MKFTLILALPAIALAAATPQTVEKRQFPDLDLPLDVPCLLQIADIRRCLPNVGSGAAPVVSDLLPCLFRFPDVVRAVLEDCVDLNTKA